MAKERKWWVSALEIFGFDPDDFDKPEHPKNPTNHAQPVFVPGSGDTPGSYGADTTIITKKEQVATLLRDHTLPAQADAQNHPNPGNDIGRSVTEITAAGMDAARKIVAQTGVTLRVAEQTLVDQARLIAANTPAVPEVTNYMDQGSGVIADRMLEVQGKTRAMIGEEKYTKLVADLSAGNINGANGIVNPEAFKADHHDLGNISHNAPLIHSGSIGRNT